MSTTWLLSPGGWDLVLDNANNIAAVDAPYALAQTAANALRVFLGECWYNKSAGMPYWQSILGYPASLPAVTAQMQQCALTVAGVTAASVQLNDVTHRTLTGTVYITDATGQTASATFSV
jgi:hypothetical protein